MYQLVPGFYTQTQSGGVSIQIANGTIGLAGGVVINPLSAADQGLGFAEDLYVSLLGPATLFTGLGTSKLIPGQWFLTPPGANVWVNTASKNHKFTAFFSSVFEAPGPPEMVPGEPGSDLTALGGEPGAGPFPPYTVTGLTTVLPSYLYQEYSDDDDLQGFVESQNEMQQNYVDTFNALGLPIYTGAPDSLVSGDLLDWVGQGLYGMARPALGSNLPNQMGPLNTYGCNWFVTQWNAPFDPSQIVKFGLNMVQQLYPTNVVITNDDLYRRILTWHFYKGDGKYFSTPWLKRRIWRFLYGIDGKSPESVDWWPNDASIADMEQISVSLGVNRNVTIRFVLGDRKVTGGAMCNAFGCNGFEVAQLVSPPWDIGHNKPPGITLNDLEGTYTPLPSLPSMATFKEALDSGVLEMPYQYNFTCTIG